jgi:nicotinamide N-methyltransferase
VLELGAGGGLPGIVAALLGAEAVCPIRRETAHLRIHRSLQTLLTDYPDAPLVQNLEHNVDRNIIGERRSSVAVAVRPPRY